MWRFRRFRRLWRTRDPGRALDWLLRSLTDRVSQVLVPDGPSCERRPPSLKHRLDACGPFRHGPR